VTKESSTATGVKYRDERVGQGDLVRPNDTVVLHLQGIRLDGTVILDTRESQPLLHQMGTSVANSELFGGSTNSGGTGGERSVVPLGMEDGILAGMRYGGIRRMVLPPALGYGHAGISRYDAFRMGLRQPVPRDEVLRFQVEILRCLDVNLGANTNNENTNTSMVGQACCTEPNYPCKIGSDS